MYYLFIRKEKDLAMFRREFDRVREAMDAGKTPVYNEMRSTKTLLCEAMVYVPVS